jgi:gas vesicle protein
MNGNSEQELQEEIEELRGALGETVQALVYKADVPARAKQRGNELKEEARERGTELRDLAMELGTELRDQGSERGSELRDQVVERSSQVKDWIVACCSELSDQAMEATERARGALSRTPRGQWAKLAGAGLALVALTVIVRKVRICDFV